MWACTSLSAEETFDLGRRMGKRLRKGHIVALFGELGAGKTLLVKGLSMGFGTINSEAVQSPTFIYLNIYQGQATVYHFDLYRLEDTDAFLSMGFEDYFFQNGLCCVEWAERITPILPTDTFTITCIHLGGDRRRTEMPLTQAAKLWGDEPVEHEGS